MSVNRALTALGLNAFFGESRGKFAAFLKELERDVVFEQKLAEEKQNRPHQVGQPRRAFFRTRTSLPP